MLDESVNHWVCFPRLQPDNRGWMHPGSGGVVMGGWARLLAIAVSFTQLGIMCLPKMLLSRISNPRYVPESKTARDGQAGFYREVCCQCPVFYPRNPADTCGHRKNRKAPLINNEEVPSRRPQLTADILANWNTSGRGGSCYRD